VPKPIIGAGEMNPKQKILFICQHNSGRSQIAEPYLKNFAGNGFLVESDWIPFGLTQKGCQRE
jgi:hypothetical protein